jgi:hypothetical protein
LKACSGHERPDTAPWKPIRPIPCRSWPTYAWARVAQLDGFKRIYLTPVFYDVRTLTILAGASCLALMLVGGSRRSLKVAIIGLVAFVPLQGLLATDWLMSLDLQFHSSGFGLYVLSGQMLTALALLIVMRVSAGPAEHAGVLGALLLTAILFWAYLAFMQYFILWSGNLPRGSCGFDAVAPASGRLPKT